MIYRTLKEIAGIFLRLGRNALIEKGYLVGNAQRFKNEEAKVSFRR